VCVILGGGKSPGILFFSGMGGGGRGRGFFQFVACRRTSGGGDNVEH
jgi:hypothetical protein